ncbi:MAG: metallophosphoesterase [Pseudomonadota bacterium]
MFAKIFGRRDSVPVPYPALHPEAPVEIVGDLHGCLDLLEALPAPSNGVTRVFVGDIIDRGPDTKGVLEAMQQLTAQSGIVCLMGNHEDMLLNFLHDPVKNRSWLHHGGLETCLSYGVGAIRSINEDSTVLELREALKTAIGPETEAWLGQLPMTWQSGNLYISHAGADPSLPMEQQSKRSLIWGHPEYQKRRRTDGIWVARGHVIVDEASAQSGRVSVDTGAYATGRLTLARIDTDGGVGFVTVSNYA